MTEEEKKQKEALLDEITSKVKGLIADSQKDVVNTKALDLKVEEINKEIAEKLDDSGKAELKKIVDELKIKNEELLDIVDKQGVEIKKLKESNLSDNNKVKTFKDLIRESIIKANENLNDSEKLLSEKNDDFGKRLSLKDYFTQKGKQNTPQIQIKSAVDMLISNIAQNNVPTIRLTELDPNRVGIPLTIYPHAIDFMPSRRITRPTMSVLVVYSYEDGSGTKTEGSASSKSSFLFKTVEFKSFFNATYFTLSDETLDDLEEALDEINIVAPDKILDSLDGKILGTTGDDSTDIRGLRTTGASGKSTAFTATDYSDTTENATIIDLISKMKLACTKNKYKPTHVILNPTEVEAISALKNAFEDSKQDRRVVFNTLGEPVSIAGLIVIRNEVMDANQCVILDVRQTLLGIRNDMTMEIGYNASDLTEGQKTVVLKTRLAFGIRDKAGIIYSSNITTDVEEINKAGQ